MQSFSLGGDKTQLLTVRVLGRSHPGANDYWDGNWVNVVIDIVVGGFRGSLGACLFSEDFVHLHQGLSKLHSSLSGRYEFEAMEEQLTLQIFGDGKGHFEINGVVIDQAANGNQLHFSFDVEQTCLPNVLAELDEIIRQFPVKGFPATT